jgi:hypothetical protein
MVFLHNSLPILLYISCKKVLKEASNIVHNNIKKGGGGVCLLEGGHPNPHHTFNIMFDSIMLMLQYICLIFIAIMCVLKLQINIVSHSLKY